VEITENPHYWLFVEARDFTSDRIWTEIEPGWHHTAFLQETVIVNRTVLIRERGPIIAVNPGIEPALIAREVGEPIRTYEVSPVVLEGTADIEGAIKVRPEEGPRKSKEQQVQQTSNVVEPAQTEEPPQALGPDENGRLGERPPRAAKEEGVQPGEKAAEKPEKPGTEAAEKLKPQGPSEKTGEAKSEKPSSKAAEEGQPTETGKTVEQGGLSSPAKGLRSKARKVRRLRKKRLPSSQPFSSSPLRKPQKRVSPARKARQSNKADLSNPAKGLRNKASLTRARRLRKKASPSS
jgi:hypothetical protein